MNNLPEVKLGIVAGSVDYLPTETAVRKRKELVDRYKSDYNPEEIYECPICIGDNEIHVKRVMRDIKKAGCNALCIFLADYGPESAGTLLADEFDGPVIICAAEEENRNDLYLERSDSLSGMLNACYALSLRKTNVCIPERPLGDSVKCARMLHDFIPVARTIISLGRLKIISFGPRPASYMAGYAPSHYLYELGVEIEENSELDLLNYYNRHKEDSRIQGIVSEMEQELGEGNYSPDALPELAQFELTLNDWIRNHKGSRDYVAMTNTCWPAFPVSFGFVPCYVNSRLTGNGIPVSCEVDVYGALSEYIGQCVSEDEVTILNINNTVPRDIYEKNICGREFNGKKYSCSDLFIGYHCGVTCSGKMSSYSLKNHYVNERLIGEEKSKGTIQGDIKAGDVTLFRIQGSAGNGLRGYIAQGQILPVRIDTYGGVGVIAVPEMERFYRHVLIGKHYTNHTVVLFGHYGKILYSVLKEIGISEVDYNHPGSIPYKDENAFDLFDGWY